jgi:hypothetical protein
MKIALFAFLTLLPVLAFSQTTSSSGIVTKIIRVRYGNPDKLAGLAANGTHVRAESDTALQVIVLKGATNDVASVEQTIRELDVPSATATTKNIELVVSVIGGSSNAAAPAEDQIPGDLGPVVKQLRVIFPYKRYQVLNSMLLRSREGTMAQNEGTMKSLAQIQGQPQPTVYSIRYDAATVTPEEGRPVIHLRNFRFATHIPVVSSEKTGVTPSVTEAPRQIQVSVISDVDLREGQKIVVGKANFENDDSALFVVLAAKLVD